MSLLIITSTVNVNSGLTVLVDPQIRLQQYIESILFYLNSSKVDKIIVCDNSGFNYSNIRIIDETASRNNKKIEFLSFKGNTNMIREFGKGFGEGEIISYAFNHSKLMVQDEASFIKVTGRLRILNLDKILKELKQEKNYFNTVNLNPFVNLRKVDTRFYQCTKRNFIDFFIDSYKEVNDHNEFYLEHVYYDKLSKNKIEYSNSKILPNFLGVSGSTGTLYNRSFINIIVRQFLFNIFRVLKMKS